MAQDPRGAVSEYDSAGLAASGVIRAAPTRLYQLWGYNSLATAQYIHLFNLVAVPANGVAPSRPPLRVEGLSVFQFDFEQIGSLFTVGLCWSNSTVLATKTLGAADCWIHCSYRPVP